MKIEQKKELSGLITVKYAGNLSGGDGTRADFFQMQALEAELLLQPGVAHRAISENAGEAYWEIPKLANVVVRLPAAPGSTIERLAYEDFEDVRITDIKIENVTREGNQTFGTLTGWFSGHISHAVEVPDPDPVPIQETPVYPTTPEPEPTQPSKSHASTSITDKGWGCFSIFFGLLGMLFLGFLLLALIAAGAQLLPWIGIVLAIFGGLWLLNKLLPVIRKIITAIVGLIALLFLGLLAIGFIHAISEGISDTKPESTETHEDKREQDESKPQIVETKDEDGTVKRDTLISHFRAWKDYAGNYYEGTWRIPVRAYEENATYRQSRPFRLETESDWTQVYGNLSHISEPGLTHMYALYDSIAKAKPMDRRQFAEMVVSGVQDVPYTLILDKDCNAESYTNEFIHDYLNAGKPCAGGVAYGLNGPVEFAANLKGDCDTRTLFLQTILRHYGYDAVILNSTVHEHSILGVAGIGEGPGIFKESGGKKYYIWETTATGFEAGQLPPAMADMSAWEIYTQNEPAL